MMKKAVMTFLILAVFPVLAYAHFIIIEVSPSMLPDPERNIVALDLSFGHPFSQVLMDMASPKQFGIIQQGKKSDLRSSLQELEAKKKHYYHATLAINRPGDVIFFVEPKPYWEPAENKYIIHYTKTIVHAFGLEESWDELVGFPIEIKPLTRPYGLWAGNLFSGQVLLDGKPVPYAEIEVAYNNRGRRLKAPNDVFHIQIIKADANGIFHYAMPKAGWWGFAALAEAKKKMEGPDGEKKPVEIGGLIWVEAKKIK